MPNPTDTTTAIQDKILSSVQVSQTAFLDSLKSWSQTAEAVSASLPQFEFPQARATEMLETTLDFSKKFFDSQREFASKVFETIVPSATNTTAATASATASAAKPRP